MLEMVQAPGVQSKFTKDEGIHARGPRFESRALLPDRLI